MLRRSRNLIPIPPQFDGPSSEASLELVKAKEYYAQDPRPDKAFDFEVYGEAEVRNALMKLFNNKCAYCEIKFVRCSPHVDPGQSGEARIFLIQDDNLTAEVPLRRSILQSTLRQKYRSTGRHNPQRDGGPEKGLYRLHPIALIVKVRNREPAKGADRPEPKGHAGRTVDWNPRRRWRHDPPDYRAQPPHPPLHTGQQGKPHSSRRCKAAVFRPQGRGWRRG